MLDPYLDPYLDFVKRKEAWEASAGAGGDLEAYLSCYADFFSSRGLDKKGWARDKSRKNRKKKWIRIGLDRVRISDPGPDVPLKGRSEPSPGNDDDLVLLEEWDALGDLESHIRSDDFQKILAVMDLADEKPEIGFYTE